MQQQLAEDPPADHLVAAYFVGQKWWTPPPRTACAGAVDAGPDAAGEWDSGLPDVTE